MDYRKRCSVIESVLPKALFREQVKELHNEMLAEIESLRAKLAEAEMDAERVEFLESLMNRPARKVRGYQYYKSSDIHITGPSSCAIYARSGIGSRCDFSAGGKTVRRAIDVAIAKQKEESK